MHKKDLFLIILAFANIYIVWGSTYLFSTFALEQLPAFRICGYRYLIASLITLAIWFVFSNKHNATRSEIKNAIIAGFVFLGLGTGGAIWSLNFLDSGFTALVISGEPLIIVLLLWIVNKQAPSLQTLFGIVLGIFGIYLLVSQSELVATEDQWIGILVILLSMLAWGGGSIFVSKAKMPDNQFLNTTIQMFIGGLTTLIISFILGEKVIPFDQWNRLTNISLAFLIVFGSVAAFTSFNYLLKKVSTEKVVTNTYVNPIIAMLLGYLYNNEVITGQSVVAAIIMLLGVFIINSNKSKQKQAA
ncbi:MAG: EamA family transporter [Saprospiraceae bacterium]|nr:EamA family transporter [Bacteroidia bacterium]NNE14973.1 EamA family transporter [Saprospiraceae bacterium]NNL92189.1 EamA family transporter [Saprospiraceae bacterium]